MGKALLLTIRVSNIFDINEVMNIALIFISIIMIVRVFQNLSNKYSSDLLPKRLFDRIFYFMLMNCLATVFSVFYLFGIKEKIFINVPILIISGISGIALTISIVLGLLAMESGAMALCSLFSNAGLIIPCIAGIFLYNEILSVAQIFGLILFFISSYLLISSTKNIYTTFSFKTIHLLIGSLIFNGLTMLSQTMFTYYIPNGNISVFSFFTFAIPTGLISIMLLFEGIFQKCNMPKLPSRLYWYGAVGAVCLFIINLLVTEATKIVSSIVLFTLLCGGNTIIAAIIGVLIFKEKLSAKGINSLALGVISLIIIKLF